MDLPEIMNLVTQELTRRGYSAKVEDPGFIQVLKGGLTFSFGIDNGKWDAEIEALYSGGVQPTEIPATSESITEIADGLVKVVEACQPDPEESSLDVIKSVTDELVARGFKATFEYPGIIHVERGGFTITAGTVNEQWTGEWYSDIETGDMVDCYTTDVDSTCTDVQTIANALTMAIEEIAPEGAN